MIKFYLFKSFMVVFLLLSIQLISQVGINNETPDPMSALDIVSTDKGLLLPRLTETQRDVMPPTGAQNGLMIYNLTENCFNYWSKEENKWSSICGKLGKAIFTVDCASIKLNGTYLNDVALTSDNSILVTVNVIKAGAYNISATSDPDNGYYFTKSGDFLSTGKYTIEIPGYGTPKNHTEVTPAGDEFIITLNGVESNPSCKFNVNVGDSSVKPEYRMDCSTAKVIGVYQKDKALDATNYIEVTIRFDATKNGAPLYINTNTVDGINFSSGSLKLDSQGLTSGWVYQTVKLMGSGAPTNFDSKLMIISSNSISSSETCQATVFVGYPKMSLYAIHGTDGRYDFSNPTYVPYKIINAPANFGLTENSTVKYQGWSSISGAINPNAATLTTALLGSNPPDIVVTGFYFHPDIAAAAVIKQYLDKGGVLIAYQEEITYTNTLIQGILGASVSAGYNSGNIAGTVYQFANVEDPVLNGPFGDIREKYWGEDASTTQTVSGLNPSEVVAYTPGNSGSVTAFRHKKLNFIFVGDGGFNSSGTSSNSISSSAYPLWINRATNVPIPNPSYSKTVYNGIFTANAFAWALERATNNGINPK